MKNIRYTVPVASLTNIISVPFDKPKQYIEGKLVTHTLYAIDTKGRLWEAEHDGYHQLEWCPCSIPDENDWHAQKSLCEVPDDYKLAEGETFVDVCPPTSSPGN